MKKGIIKKLWPVFSMLFLCGCDGDLIVDEIDFSSASIETCTTNSSLLFQINGSEAIILNVPDNFIQNEVTDQEGITSSIPGQSQFFYRLYSANVSQSFFCSELVPSSPTVTDELEATNGTVTLVTQQFVENNASILVNTININNLVLLNDNGERLIDSDFNFGETIVSNGAGAAFDTGNLQICPTDPSLLFNINENQAIVVDLPDGIIMNQETAPEGVDAIIENGATLRYFIFEDPIASDFFCTNLQPDTAQAIASAGTINVVTTETIIDGITSFSHSITVSDLVLLNDRDMPLLGTNISLGNVSTSN